MDLSLKEIAKNLEIGVSSLYKWKETRKKLYKFIIENSNKKNYIIENSEINRYFSELNHEEKEMYLSEIKARVLRKKLK